MIKVLFLNATLDVGGAEKALAELVMSFDRQRFHPVICCLYGLGFVGEQLRSHGLKVYGRLMRHKLDILGVVCLIRLMRQEGIDILYLNNQPLTQFWGVVAARLAGVPVVVSVLHYTHRSVHSWRGRWANSQTQRWTDKFIALAQTQKAYIAQHERLCPDRIVVIPNGIDVQRFQQLTIDPTKKRQELGLPLHGSIVGIVAQLRPEKNHRLFLQAAQYLVQVRPDVAFLVIGDGPERIYLEALARELGISEKVHFLGLRHDIPELMSLCDAGVLCSFAKSVETFPLAVLEFMAAGKPVVATNVGSLSEILVPGETGWLVPEGDVEALVQAILTILKDRATAERMGLAGRERVRQHFTGGRMVLQTELLLETLWSQKAQFGSVPAREHDAFWP